MNEDQDGPDPDAVGDFERYALVAALTLFVLCLILVDRARDLPEPPPGDRDDLMVVEIGGPPPAR